MLLLKKIITGLKSLFSQEVQNSYGNYQFSKVSFAIWVNREN